MSVPLSSYSTLESRGVCEEEEQQQEEEDQEEEEQKEEEEDQEEDHEKEDYEVTSGDKGVSTDKDSPSHG